MLVGIVVIVVVVLTMTWMVREAIRSGRPERAATNRWCSFVDVDRDRMDEEIREQERIRG